MLRSMVASVTFPVPGSTVMTQTPLPVTSRRFASYGYSGSGAADCHGLSNRKRHRNGGRDAGRLGLNRRTLPPFRARFLCYRCDRHGQIFRRRLLFSHTRSLLTWWTRGATRAGLGLFLFARKIRRGRFFRQQASVRGAAQCFALRTVAKVCEFGSVFFFFGFEFESFRRSEIDREDSAEAAS